MRTKSVWLALAVLGAAALLAGCAARSTDQAAPAQPRATQVATKAVTTVSTTVTYRADGSLAVRNLGTLTGSCFTGTIAAAPSVKGFRCIGSHNRLLDPCVAPPGVAHPTVVACRSDPWSGATVLKLTSALPAPDPLSQVTRPWAMQLAGGSRCVAVTGTVGVSHGIDLVYTCTDGSGAGTPARGAGGLWHADHVSAGGVVTRATAVTQIWQI